MSALTSLLVRDRIVPVSKIEEALQTQVLSGGDIDTVLLEMDLVPEDVLSAYRAAMFGLLPATRDEVMRAPRDAVTRVPQRIAKDKNLVPLLLDGRALVVAAIEPLTELEARALRDQLGYDVTARIVTRPRLQAGLAHHYGLELAPRTRRLVDALRRREPGIIPYVRPPSPSMMPRVQAASIEEKDESSAVHLIDTGEDSSETALDAADLGPEPQEETSPDELPPLAVDDASQLDTSQVDTSQVDPGSEAEAADVPVFAMSEAPPANDQPADERADESGEPRDEAHEQEAHEQSQPAEAAAAPVHAPVSARAPEGALRPQVRSTPRALAENLAAGLEVGRATTLPPQNLTAAIASAARGPISSERAIQLLGQAQQRDDVLFLLLRYTQQFFDFVAIFSVGKEGARGRMAHGVGLSQELMEHLIVPLEGGGLFARSVRDRRALVGDFAATDEERAAAALLGRSVNRPALVVPILLRGRAVLLVHADRDGIAVDDAACIQEVAAPVKDALQRIILQNKTLRRGSLRPAASLPEGDSALESSGPIPLDLSGPGPVAPSEGQPGESEPAPADSTTPRASLRSGPDGMQLEAELTAVDLEAVSRLGLTRRSDGETPISGADVAHEARAPRDGAWGKLPGIPRSAPPPPRRDSGAPGPTSVGSYRYVAASGLVAEKVRQRDSGRNAPASPSASVPPEAARPSRTSVKGTPANANNAGASNDEAATRRESTANRPSNKRLSLVTPEPNQPSVIIDMGDQVSFLVEGLMQAPRNEEPPQVAELLKLGESALPVLIQHFPGPLWFDRATLRAGRVPRGGDVSGVARALCAFGEKAAPYLAGKLASGDDELSYFALLVAGEIVHPDLLDAVARRALGPDDVLRHVALDVLRRYTRLPQFSGILRALSDLSERPGKDPRRQHLAVVALGSLRDARTLQTLIARLSDGTEAIAEAAHEALVELTAQDFGPTPRRWEAWAEQFGSQHRIEWLIESLMHVEPELRTLASEELKRETQQYFGYHPGMPKRDRELSQRKYREWWQHEGKTLFLG